MALHRQIVDGNQDLAAQEKGLNFMEQSTFAKVISYAKSTGPIPQGLAPNEVVLQDVPIGQQPKALHLEALDVNGDATQVITQQLATGKIVVFHDISFVGGQERMVLGFR